MPQVTCSRCFAVFDAEGLRPGQPPLCPACAPRRTSSSGAGPASAPGGPVAPPERAERTERTERSERTDRAPPARVRRQAPTRPGRRRTGWIGIAAALALVAAGLAWFATRGAPPAPAPTLTPVAQQALEWKSAGLASGVAPGLNPRAVAEQRIAAGRAALAADLPERNPEAARAFRDALVADSTRLDALAGWVIAVASQPEEAIRGEDLTIAHELLRWARDRSPDRPELVAAYARILLAVPGEKNRAEALSVAWKAGALAPRDPDARLALGLSRLASDPAGAVRVLDAELDRPEIDRRLLTAAARARWANGDVARAIALTERRLALDPGHPEALELQAEILLSGGQVDAARAVLQRYASAHAESPRPPYLLARVAAQVDGRLAEARRLLASALERHPDDFLAARILAQAAAVERAAGDAAAAQRAVAAALQRVPANAPAQYQAALLAFSRGDARGLREAAGVLGDRGGTAVAAAVNARSAELSATADEAAVAWEAAASAAKRDPVSVLVAAGAVARLGFNARALALCERAFERDLGEARLRRAVSDFWNGAPLLAESSKRLAAIARGEGRVGAVLLACAGTAEQLQGASARAEELGRRALTLGPQLPQPAILLGYVALARGDARASAAWATSALEGSPGQPAALALRARSLEAVGRRLEAQGAWREALDAVPDLTAGRLALGRLLVLDGKPAEARPLLESLVAEEPDAVEAVGALRDLRAAGGPPP